MKKFESKIYITLRAGILDVQGKQVEHALHSIEYKALDNVRVGRYVTLDVEAENYEAAMEKVDGACQKLIANPIIEDYSIDLTEA
jgi:phosphoribosylformylglycinamidine synthase